jgi:putative membrane protein
MIPSGFLGTRGDLLTDLVVLSFVIILPILIFSWIKVRNHSYALHKRIQIGLGILLLLAVTAFEVDIQLKGGSGVIFDASPHGGTWWFRTILTVHLMIASITTIIWAVLIYKSLKKFPSPPQPGEFSATHKRWGTIGMVAMILTGLTAYPLYFFGFAA